MLKELGEPKRAEIQKLYQSETLTILNVIWAPKMTIMPHDHRMWAVIGVYSGREDNIFWRRVPGVGGGKLEAAGARALSTGDAEPLGHNIIHSVTNPIRRLTGAIHVYGGDSSTQRGASGTLKRSLRSATMSRRTSCYSRRRTPTRSEVEQRRRINPPRANLGQIASRRARPLLGVNLPRYQRPTAEECPSGLLRRRNDGQLIGLCRLVP